MSFLMDLLFVTVSGIIVNLFSAAGTVPFTLFTELVLGFLNLGPTS